MKGAQRNMRKTVKKLTTIILACTLLICSAAADTAAETVAAAAAAGASYSFKDIFTLDGYANIADDGEYFQAQANGKSMLIEKDTGKIVISGMYDFINPIDSAHFVVGKDGMQGVIDIDGNVRVPMIYEVIYPLDTELDRLSDASDLLICMNGDDYGAISLDGSVIIPMEEKRYLNYYTDDYLIAERYSEDGSNVYGLYDKAGNLLLPYEYSDMMYPEHGYIAVSKQNGVSSILDMQLNTVFSVEAESISVCSENRVIYRKKDGQGAGFLNMKGEPVGLPIYDDIWPMMETDNKVAVAFKDGKIGLVDFNGNAVTECIYDTYSSNNDSHIYVTKDERWGALDFKGNVIVPFNYDYVGSFYNDYDVLALEGKYGIVDKDGDIVIPIVYDSISTNYSDEDILMVSSAGKYGAIDMQGNVIIPFEYDYIQSYCRAIIEAIVIDGLEEKYGVFSTDGKLILPLGYADSDFYIWDGYVSSLRDGIGEIRSDKGDVIFREACDRILLYGRGSFAVYSGGKTTMRTIVETVQAEPSTSAVLINGKAEGLEAYKIDGSNYVKLRDLAYVLNSTSSPFDIEAQAGNSIRLTPNSAYTPVGGELTPVSGSSLSARRSNIQLYVKDLLYLETRAYNIEGNNYILLRDLAKILDLTLSWNPATDTISISTAVRYPW